MVSTKELEGFIKPLMKGRYPLWRSSNVVWPAAEPSQHTNLALHRPLCISGFQISSKFTSFPFTAWVLTYEL